MGHDEHALSRPPEGGGRDAGPDRHGDVHPPARRSRRLEHAARERPLGADVQEREVRLEPGRLRLLQGARRGSAEGPGQRRLVPRFGAAGRRDGQGRRWSRAPPSSRTGSGSRRRPATRPARSASSSNRRGDKALFCGDILHHAVQVYHPEWNSFACLDQDNARKSRRAAIEHCAGSGAMLMPCHFGAPFHCHIDHKGAGFAPRFADNF